MITDQIVEALNVLIDLCDNEEHKKAIEAAYDMLLDYDDNEYWAMSDAERTDWVRQYMLRIRIDKTEV